MKPLALSALLVAALLVTACGSEPRDDGPDAPAVATPTFEIVLPGTPRVGERYEFSLATIGGSEVSTDTLAGKVVVLDFWATWCGPCVAALPHLRELHDEHGDDLAIVGLSFDRSRNRLTNFLADAQLPWPQVFLSRGMQDQIGAATGISTIPRMFVLDREGRLVTTHGHHDLDTLVPELIASADG